MLWPPPPWFWPHEFPIRRDFVASSLTLREIQPSEKHTSTVKFKDVNIQSDSLPILQKVWEKHGDVIEGSQIRSLDFIATALESLAKVILILQSSSGKTLTDDQANYISSMISDLRLMRFKVDWLAPFVQNAMVLHKRRPLEAAFIELDKAKARVEEMERKFLEEMAEISSDGGGMPETMPQSGLVEMEKCLGEGLW